jgi:Resolvase, N terminal domain/Helix-turn-helix domain of resolvase
VPHHQQTAVLARVLDILERLVELLLVDAGRFRASPRAALCGFPALRPDSSIGTETYVKGRAAQFVVWKLDRLARSPRDLLETKIHPWKRRTVHQSISEPWADSTSHAGKMIMTVFAGIAEFERDLIRQRMAAKSKRVRFGRPRKLNPQQTKLAKPLLDEGKLVSEIAETFGVHVATIYRLGAALERSCWA